MKLNNVFVKLSIEELLKQKNEMNSQILAYKVSMGSVNNFSDGLSYQNACRTYKALCRFIALKKEGRS